MMEGEYRQCWQYDAPSSCGGVFDVFLKLLGLLSALVGFMYNYGCSNAT